MKGVLAMLVLAATAAAPTTSTVPVPGAIFAQTARAGATITTADKEAKPQALKAGETFAASGQTLDATGNAAVTLIFSNGEALSLPRGGKLTFGEFTQKPVADTSRDRAYEPTQSTLRLSLAQGLLVASGRKADITSTFALTTPLAQFDCQSPSFLVTVEADKVTFILLDGTAQITVPDTGFHDTLQAGQTATLLRDNLHKSYPLQLTGITTADNQQYTAWLTAARTAESRVTFTGLPGRLQPSQLISQPFTQQMSVDDPRFRQ